MCVLLKTSQGKMVKGDKGSHQDQKADLFRNPITSGDLSLCGKRLFLGKNRFKYCHKLVSYPCLFPYKDSDSPASGRAGNPQDWQLEKQRGLYPCLESMVQSSLPSLESPLLHTLGLQGIGRAANLGMELNGHCKNLMLIGRIKLSTVQSQFHRFIPNIRLQILTNSRILSLLL